MEEKIELRSEEVQEIMGKAPSWILRWGITVMFILIILFFVGCYFFKFPESLTAKITLTTATPPVELYARNTGKLAFVAVSDKQKVHTGDILAVIQSSAEFKDIEEIKNLYLLWKNKKISIDELAILLAKKDWQLGELQNVFLEFKGSIDMCINYQKRNYYPRKIAIRKEMQRRQQNINLLQNEEIILGSRQFELAKKIFIRDSILFQKKIDTEENYDRSTLSYLQSRQKILEHLLSQKKIYMQQVQDKEMILDLIHQYEETFSECKQALLIAENLFGVQLKVWEQSYVLKSPIDGIINMIGIWSENQHVTTGNLVFIILPEKPDLPIGKALLPIAGAGKIKIGQRVNVRLNNFPDKEYGFLIGRVHNISEIPDKERNYFIQVSFPNGLKTNYQKELPLSKQMAGTAQIIIKDKRLIERFIEPISKLIREHKY